MILVFMVAVVAVHLLRSATRPAPVPRIVCASCGREFLDDRVLGWHLQAAHPETFDDRPVMPAEYRNPREGTAA